MGTVYHDAIIVTSWNPEAISAAQAQAVTLGLNPVGPVRSGVNCYLTLVIPPDGSTLGWPDREVAEKARETFMEWLRTDLIHEDGSGPLEWAAVRYGSDHSGNVGRAAIVTGSSR